MATIEENLRQWTSYAWSKGGDEWSEVWGGTPNLWYGTLWPRLRTLLPAGRGLEIAPGFGRFTHYLKDLCGELAIVDLTPACIAACRERFSAATNISYHVNDGTSLAFLEDGAVDFAFSFDSLVHAEAEVLRAYVHELGRVLAPHGVAFLHHSNMEAFRDPVSGELPQNPPHWRAPSMSARRMREFCAEAGLVCVAQELVNWGVPAQLNDAFSLLTRPGSRRDRPLAVRENPRFMDEALALKAAAELFAGG